MTDLMGRIDDAVEAIVAAAPTPPRWATIVERRHADHRHRPMYPIALAGGLAAAAVAAAIVVLPNRGEAPSPATQPGSEPVAAPTTEAPTTTTSTPPVSVIGTNGILGAALPGSLPEGLVIWSIQLSDGAPPGRGIPGEYSTVDVAMAGDPFRRMISIQAVQREDDSLEQRRDDYVDGWASQPEQYRWTAEIVEVAGEPRLVKTGPNGDRRVEWFDGDIVVSVVDSGVLRDDELEAVVEGTRFADPAAAAAAEAEVWNRIGEMPLIASTPLDGETIEYRSLSDVRANALCVVDAAGMRRCRLQISEADIVGNAGGDVIVDIPDQSGESHTYGWISVPATLSASNESTPVNQTTIDGQTWFRIDAPDGSYAAITIDHGDAPGEFTRGFEVGGYQQDSTIPLG